MIISTVRERPILFSGPMVRAIQENRKTQTRRVITRIDGYKEFVAPGKRILSVQDALTELPGLREHAAQSCPSVDDRLWVRETWAALSADSVGRQILCAYRADGEFDPGTIVHPRAVPLDFEWSKAFGYLNRKWRPSIHMPRWASRIILKVTGVRVEQVQDISEEDTIAEGITDEQAVECWYDGPQFGFAFSVLWDSINAKRGYGWDVNPWVRVVEFERVE